LRINRGGVLLLPNYLVFFFFSGSRRFSLAAQLAFSPRVVLSISPSYWSHGRKTTFFFFPFLLTIPSQLPLIPARMLPFPPSKDASRWTPPPLIGRTDGVCSWPPPLFKLAFISEFPPFSIVFFSGGRLTYPPPPLLFRFGWPSGFFVLKN